tara:strand:- start:468 stop:1220 length:753 start_codon:yes stop_codon:yes gene_type:complete
MASNLYKINEGPDPTIGRDIDKEIVTTINGEDYGDYDIFRTARTSSVLTSGTNPQEMQQMYGSGSNENILQDDDSFNRDWDKGMQIDEINNGRMHDVKTINTNNNLGKGEDLVMIKDNQETSIKGLLEYNALNDNFFSDTNRKVLQDSLRYGVYKNTNYVISDQSPRDLFIIMRSIALQFANFGVSSENLIDEIKKLNKKVLEYCIENVSSNVQQHMGYINDIQKLPMPMSHPKFLNKDNYTYDLFPTIN